jgi:hypothetical protein
VIFFSITFIVFCCFFFFADRTKASGGGKDKVTLSKLQSVLPSIEKNNKVSTLSLHNLMPDKQRPTAKPANVTEQDKNLYVTK